ncbi:uncharacterized protein LOC125664926 [Ostrea edulis]|uniref:uncharacterized protein LOC125664926 n=1 Tax=Ostrea edulis TaxID=37623 RepID=UPI0024AF4CBA|nr:uncharacterized protein LOC125664926 [Ostrea edulis]
MNSCFFVLYLSVVVLAEPRQQHVDPPVPPGGQKVVNVTNPRVIEASLTGIEEINQLNGYGETMLREVIYKVINATEQVVNGELLRLDMEVGPSECFNTIMNIGKNSAECPLLSSELVHPCFTEVLLRNWTVPQHLALNVSCQPIENVPGVWPKQIV